MEERRQKNEQEIKALAAAIAVEIKAHQECQLTEEEQQAVRDLIKTKRNAVRAALWLFGAVLLWVAKDIYIWIAAHTTFNAR
ncbi:MAG: hypothetical protein AABZ23_06455 [Deltaproteobacteria bacterium]